MCTIVQHRIPPHLWNEPAELCLFSFGYFFIHRGRVQNSIKNTLNLMHSITLVRANSAYFGQKYIKKIHGISTSTMSLSLSLLSIIICQGIILQVSFLKFLVLPPGPRTPPPLYPINTMWYDCTYTPGTCTY